PPDRRPGPPLRWDEEDEHSPGTVRPAVPGRPRCHSAHRPDPALAVLSAILPLAHSRQRDAIPIGNHRKSLSASAPEVGDTGVRYVYCAFRVTPEPAPGEMDAGRRRADYRPRFRNR